MYLMLANVGAKEGRHRRRGEGCNDCVSFTDKHTEKEGGREAVGEIRSQKTGGKWKIVHKFSMRRSSVRSPIKWDCKLVGPPGKRRKMLPTNWNWRISTQVGPKNAERGASYLVTTLGDYQSSRGLMTPCSH